ncbi:sigma-70 family RNA polymerase sigma factor [Streptomyces bottropensis]|uniref:RNA polymerase sigma factor 70 region 4 type 2 domain-containing protein n=1 Tax=Streptomyces bottropensis ATCC 25435 TaxID=1054862 RepID=M3FHH9_9ACTN|nr:sigma-70 family RNA polymerase sigma factor [Streptomyces bottropensis]EMF52385.1 hypothetical protein SBD_5461 [Streptomyces bottropensis ATCC 25435]MZD21503.1 sigma-70 family RNA polymerase sigma factor [Streptomyces sp. SID5476]
MPNLFAERYEQMVGYARKRLHRYGVPPSAADPEDVVQTAFALVLARTDPIEHLRAYVFTVIRNEVSQAAKRYGTGQAYGRLDTDVRLETAGTAVDPCGTADLRIDLEAALGELPLQQRRAVLCHKAFGLTQAETATVMRTAPGTVATHVSRAVVTLRVALSALALVLMTCGTVWMWGGVTGAIPAAGYEMLKGPYALLVAAAVSFVSLFASAGAAWSSYCLYRSVRSGEEVRTSSRWLSDQLRRFLGQLVGGKAYDHPSSSGPDVSGSFNLPDSGPGNDGKWDEMGRI